MERSQKLLELLSLQLSRAQMKLDEVSEIACSNLDWNIRSRQNELDLLSEVESEVNTTLEFIVSAGLPLSMLRPFKSEEQRKREVLLSPTVRYQYRYATATDQNIHIVIRVEQDGSHTVTPHFLPKPRETD